MISVLFVCLGNICRSPMAEAVFRHQLKARGLEDDRWCRDRRIIQKPPKSEATPPHIGSVRLCGRHLAVSHGGRGGSAALEGAGAGGRQ